MNITLHTPLDIGISLVLGVFPGELFSIVETRMDYLVIENAWRGRIAGVPLGWMQPVELVVGQTVRTKSLASGAERVGVIRKIDGPRCAGIEVLGEPGGLWWVSANEIIAIEES
jgi:hypothetical protein